MIARARDSHRLLCRSSRRDGMVLLAALILSGLWPRPPVTRLVTGARRLVACAPCREPRLLLTSAGLTTPELRSSFFSMLRRASAPGATPRIAMLVTAQMAPSGTPSNRSPGELRRRRWSTAVKNAKQIEAELGVAIECVDCANDNKPIEEFERPLATAECIWVTGGNTFFLWHHMRRRGLHNMVRQRVLNDGCLYVGQSAGAIVAGATIRPAYFKGWDDPAAGGALEGVRWTDKELRCMGLAPNRAFFPHYDQRWESTVQERKGELGSAELVCLTDDGSVAYVSGEEEQDDE